MKEIIYNEKGEVIKVRTINNEPSMSHQQFKDECDINKIINKYKKTGEITHLNRKRGAYADISNFTSYQESLDTIIKADHAFSTLSSDVRKKFNNDPAELIKFLADPKNNQEAVKLGLKEQIQPTDLEQNTNELKKLNKQNDNKKNDQDKKTKTPE